MICEQDSISPFLDSTSEFVFEDVTQVFENIHSDDLSYIRSNLKNP